MSYAKTETIQTAKQILRYLKNEIYADVSDNTTTYKDFVSNDYGWLWEIVDNNKENTTGQSMDVSTLYDYDIEIVDNPNAIGNYIIKIYPNRYKNLLIRCEEYKQILLNNYILNNPLTNQKALDNQKINSETWNTTILPGGNKKLWKRPDLGRVPVLRNLYKNINNLLKEPIYIKYNLNQNINNLDSSYGYNSSISTSTPIKGQSTICNNCIVNDSPDIRQLTKLPNIHLANSVSEAGIQMYVKSIKSKQEKINIAQYWINNAWNYKYLNKNLGKLFDNGKTNSLDWKFFDGTLAYDKDIDNFNAFLSKKYSIEFGLLNKSKFFDLRYGTRPLIRDPQTSAINWIDDITNPMLEFWSFVNKDMFFESYLDEYNYVSRDVDTVEYWELELVDPTELVDSPTNINTSDEVCQILKSSVASCDSGGIVPFDNYDTSRSTIIKLQKSLNKNFPGYIRITDPVSRKTFDRYIGYGRSTQNLGYTDTGTIEIDSTTTVINNQKYNVNTVRITYTLQDSILLGGTDDLTYIRQGLNSFGLNSRIESKGITTTPSATDPDGIYFKYTNNSGYTSIHTLDSFLNGLYVHYVTRYDEVRESDSNRITKEVITLSNIPIDLEAINANIDQKLSKRYPRIETFVVGNIIAKIQGRNPFTAESLSKSEQLSTIARYLGAGVGDLVELKIYPVGFNHQLENLNLDTESSSKDRNNYAIPTDPIINNSSQYVFCADLKIIKPSINNTQILSTTNSNLEYISQTYNIDITVNTLENSDKTIVGTGPFGIKINGLTATINDRNYLSAIARYMGFSANDNITLAITKSKTDLDIELYGDDVLSVGGVKSVSGLSYGGCIDVRAYKTIVGSSLQITSTPTSTSTPTTTPTNTPTSTVTNTPTNTTTVSVSPTNTTTQTPSPSITNTQTPSNTPNSTSTPTVTPTNTTTPTVINLSNDYFFNYVSLLIYSYGQESGSTIIRDSSKYNHVFNIEGSPKAVSDETIIGGTSYLFSDFDHLTTSQSNNEFNFQINDFTVEAWVYLLDYDTNKTIKLLTTYGQIPDFSFEISGTGQLLVNDGSIVISMSNDNAISIKRWYHVAFSRENGILRSFIDGNVIVENNNNTNFNTVQTISIMGSNRTNVNPSYIDGLRITQFIGRYNSNFTPPIMPYTQEIVSTPLPTPTKTPTPSLTSTVTPSTTPTTTNTSTLTSTPTSSITPTATVTSSQTPTPTYTKTPTVTSSQTQTPTPSTTITTTPTTTNTSTPTPTTTQTISCTSTLTLTPTSTLTKTATPTTTSTPTPSTTSSYITYNENLNNSLSTNSTNPTFINLITGRNRIVFSSVTGNPKYLGFSINDGLRIDNVVLVNYDGNSSNTFALQLGSSWNISNNIVATQTITSENIEQSLLSISESNPLIQKNYTLLIDGSDADCVIDLYVNIIPLTPTPTKTSTPTPTTTNTVTPTITSTNTLTATPTPTTTTTATATTTPTSTPTPTSTITTTPTTTPTVTNTSTPTSTITTTPTQTPSVTPTLTPTTSQVIIVNNFIQPILQWGKDTQSVSIDPDSITILKNKD